MLIIALFIIAFTTIIMLCSAREADRTDKQLNSVMKQLFDYYEPGAITYEGLLIKGWYLEPSHEHFMAEDGRRFTYVDAHTRNGREVSGYWRLIN